jgi:hypothetical protein
VDREQRGENREKFERPQEAVAPERAGDRAGRRRFNMARVSPGWILAQMFWIGKGKDYLPPQGGEGTGKLFMNTYYSKTLPLFRLVLSQFLT